MSRQGIKHWLDRFVDRLLATGKKRFVISGGMAISGPIHIGKLRGEVIYPSGIARALRRAGKEVRHIVVVYTQDPLKAKERLVPRSFINEWSGVRILDVPDPWGCHENWVEHFFEPYMKHYEEYGITATPIMTHEIYKDRRMVETVRFFIKNRERAREILNRYKGGKLGPGWFPVRPLCKKCGNIRTTKILDYDGEKGLIRYMCPRCGHVGEARLSDVKLEWRAEWVALWNVLEVDVELYGKDHAAAGGSRDSCNELYRKLFGKEPPMGFPFEWVSLKVDGRSLEMSSSGGIVFTMDEWLEVGLPEVLKYWYYVMRPMSHLEFDPVHGVPHLHEEYSRAERIYFGLEEPADPDKIIDIRRAYELANDDKVPPKPPFQAPYTLLAVISQIIPSTENVDAAIEKLRQTGHLKDELEEWEVARLARLLRKAYTWVKRYAPKHYRVEIREEADPAILERIGEDGVKLLKEVETLLKDWEGRDAVKLEEELYSKIRGLGLSPKKGFRILYMAILGRGSGPKLAPLILAVGPRKIASILGRYVEVAAHGL